MLRATYTAASLQGYAREGFTARRDEANALAAHMGGSVGYSYFTAGGDELYLIIDMPDDAAANALILAANSSGAARVQAMRLLSLEEMDDATRRAPTYRPPGEHWDR